MARTKIVKTTTTKPTKKKYLTNKELLKEIEKSHQLDKMSDDFAKMIMMLTHRYAQKGEYANYSYNEDMQGFAIMTVCKVWKSFDSTKSQNPFAYFTQTIKHAFFQYLNMEKKQRNIKDELIISNGDNPSMGFLDREDNDDAYYNDYYNTLIISPTEDTDTNNNR